ncbi:MAG: hypothetical protein ACRC62_32750 [Microcoleus sp.]
MDELEAKRQEIDCQYELTVLPSLIKARSAIQSMLVTVDELLELIRNARSAQTLELLQKYNEEIKNADR